MVVFKWYESSAGTSAQRSWMTRAWYALLPIPWGTYVLDLWLSVLCMRSKAWLAARVSLRLARLPHTASSAQRSRRLTRAAAPVLLAHAEVTKT